MFQPCRCCTWITRGDRELQFRAHTLLIDAALQPLQLSNYCRYYIRRLYLDDVRWMLSARCPLSNVGFTFHVALRTSLNPILVIKWMKVEFICRQDGSVVLTDGVYKGLRE